MPGGSRWVSQRRTRAPVRCLTGHRVKELGGYDGDGYEQWVAGRDPEAGEARGRLRRDGNTVRFVEITVKRSQSLVTRGGTVSRDRSGVRRCTGPGRRGISVGLGGRSSTRWSRGSGDLLWTWPTIPPTVVAERIGWEHSIRTLCDRVSELRPDPASRTTYLAAKVAQCDFWLPGVTISVEFGQTRRPALLPALVMVLGYLRWLCARLLRAVSPRTCSPAGGFARACAAVDMCARRSLRRQTVATGRGR